MLWLTIAEIPLQQRAMKNWISKFASKNALAVTGRVLARNRSVEANSSWRDPEYFQIADNPAGIL